MAADPADLLAALDAERAYVDGLVTDADWSTPTPAPGWDVHDQVWHLAYFDGAAALSLGDPDAFAALATRVARDPVAFEAEVVAEGRGRSRADVTAEWTRHRAALAAAVPGAGARVPWFGLAMTPASLLTARIMETWAHGVDIADGLGAALSVSDRLAHVVFLAWRAVPYAYTIRGLTLPPNGIRIEASLPSGDMVTLGPPDADGTVTGSALDLALVATQRRHPQDTRLVAYGAGREWLGIAQTFAGPPGAGRAPLT